MDTFSIDLSSLEIGVLISPVLYILFASIVYILFCWLRFLVYLFRWIWSLARGSAGGNAPSQARGSQVGNGLLLNLGSLRTTLKLLS